MRHYRDENCKEKDNISPSSHTGNSDLWLSLS